MYRTGNMVARLSGCKQTPDEGNGPTVTLDNNCGCQKVGALAIRKLSAGCQVTSYYSSSLNHDIVDYEGYASYMPGVCCVSDCLTIQVIAYLQDQILQM